MDTIDVTNIFEKGLLEKNISESSNPRNSRHENNAHLPLYQQLIPADSAFRPCQVLSGSWNQPIKSLMSVHEDRSRVPYHYLSQGWGDPINSVSITVNDRTMDITRNLLEAMRRWRWRNRASKIWIDALCINQNDAEEKSARVSGMTETYAGALEVFA